MSDKPTIDEILEHLDNEGPELNTATDIDAMTHAIGSILADYVIIKAQLGTLDARLREIGDLQAELAQVKGEREHYYDKFWELSRESSKTIIELEARLALAEPLLKALKESSDTHCLPVDVADEFEVYRQALAKPEGEKGEEHD
jgi:hypothetical protein